MDPMYARFVYEVTRAGERIEREQNPAQPAAPLPAQHVHTMSSWRHSLAVLLHRLAERLDVREVRPA